jgi:hypothetical protein
MKALRPTTSDSISVAFDDEIDEFMADEDEVSEGITPMHVARKIDIQVEEVEETPKTRPGLKVI